MLAELARFLLTRWWTAFLLTLAIEVPIFTWLTHKTVPFWRSAVGGVLCSCLTHPLLWFVWREVVTDRFWYIASGELIVSALESVVFFAIARPIRFWQAVSISFLANAASYGFGLLISTLV